MDVLKKVHAQAKKNPRRVVFTEGFDDRIVKAAVYCGKNKICKPVILGKPKISKADETFVEIIDFEKEKELQEKFAKEINKLREHNGVNLEKAKAMIKERNYFGTMLLKSKKVDGFLSGAGCSTADTIRPSLQLIKSKNKVSSCFLMIMKDKNLVFADCAIQINPTAKELAQIAIDTEKTSKRFGIKPRVAMLSFSTKGSAQHEFVDKVVEATKIASRKINVDGELQADAALVADVAKIKCPKSKIAGRANVLIFPDLQSGNIAYKLVQRLANAKAIGPILQGMPMPVNDLSRGCSVQDIIDMAAITCVEAQGKL